MFEQVDRPALNPLPSQPFVFGYWKQAKVNLDYHIEVERHYYSVPYWFVSTSVQVKIGEQLVEIFHENQRIACHERSRVSHRHTTLPEHMPPEHWAYKQQSKQRFLAWAEQMGAQTTAQVNSIFNSKAHEEQAFRALKGLQRRLATIRQAAPGSRLPDEQMYLAWLVCAEFEPFLPLNWTTRHSQSHHNYHPCLSTPISVVPSTTANFTSIFL